MRRRRSQHALFSHFKPVAANSQPGWGQYLPAFDSYDIMQCALSSAEFSLDLSVKAFEARYKMMEYQADLPAILAADKHKQEQAKADGQPVPQF